MNRLLYLLFLILIPNCAFSWSTDLNLFYNSDTFTTATTSTNSLIYYSGAANFTLSNSTRIGWAITGITNSTNNGSTTTSFATTDMGIRFTWIMTRSRSSVLNITYNLQANSTYNNGTDTYVWKGTSLAAEIGYMPEINEGKYAGVKLTYYSNSIKEQIVGSSTYSQVAYARNIIIPTFAMRWEY